MSTPWLPSPSAHPIIAAVLAGGLVAALALAGVLDGFERSEYDLLFRLRGPQAPAASIVIAAIGPASLSASNRVLPQAAQVAVASLTGVVADATDRRSPAAGRR